MARYDDLKTGPIAYAAFVSSILLLLIILLVRALCYGWVNAEDDAKLAGSHYVSADEEIADQKAKISSYGKAMVEVAAPAGPDAEGTDAPPAEPVEEERLHIPVERAKELLLEDLRSRSNSRT
jgi:hypothetical protein